MAFQRSLLVESCWACGLLEGEMLAFFRCFAEPLGFSSPKQVGKSETPGFIRPQHLSIRWKYVESGVLISDVCLPRVRL